MIPRHRTRCAGAALLLLCLIAAPARADWLFTPFIATSVGSSTTFVLPDAAALQDKKIFFGGAATLLGDGVLGVEGEFAYAPNFFRHDPDRPQSSQAAASNAVQASNTPTNTPTSHVMTIMGNAIVTLPLSVTHESLRPYAVVGFGVLDAAATTQGNVLDFAETSKAMDVGGGAIGMLGRRTGVRFDVRHFRTLGQSTNAVNSLLGPRLSYWRLTFGVVIRPAGINYD